MDFSIILPVYNEEKSIKSCLQSLLELDCKSMEIIVVNDGSTDGTKKILESFGNKIKLINLEKNTGRNNALMNGVSKANGRFFAFIDGDCIVPKNWLELFAKEFEEKEVIAVGGSVKPLCLTSFSEKTFYLIDLVFSYFFGKKISTNMLGGANNSVKADFLKKTGNYAQTAEFAEDTETFFRLKNFGKIVYDESNFVLTKYPETLHAGLRRKFFYGMGIAKVFKKSGIQSIQLFLRLIALNAVAIFLLLSFASVLLVDFDLFVVFLLPLVFFHLVFAIVSLTACIKREKSLVWIVPFAGVFFLISELSYLAGFYSEFFKLNKFHQF